MDEHDLELRRAAHERARRLADLYQDIVPLDALRHGFEFRGRRLSFGSFQRGIHRPKEMHGRAALTLVTAPPKPGKPPPYPDEIDVESRSILYHYRAGSPDLADNRALIAAFEDQTPLIYFHGLAPGQYSVILPVFVTANDPAARVVLLEVGSPIADMAGEGVQSSVDYRDYAMREVRVRLHQHRFRFEVLRAYRNRCAVCALREPKLVEAAHIVGDAHAEGAATVVNGIALCAMHHLAYDRNLMGIDPARVVHIAASLRDMQDGPMLRSGIQEFHGREIEVPRRREEHPDPERLAARFELFSAVA